MRSANLSKKTTRELIETVYWLPEQIDRDIKCEISKPGWQYNQIASNVRRLVSVIRELRSRGLFV